MNYKVSKKENANHHADSSLMNSATHLRKRMIAIPHNIFQKIEEEGIFSNLSYHGKIILIPKLSKNIIKKENNRPLSLVNIYGKMITPFLENLIKI